MSEPENITMEMDAFADLVRAIAWAEGMDVEQMIERGFTEPHINLITNLRDAITTFDNDNKESDNV